MLARVLPLSCSPHFDDDVGQVAVMGCCRERGVVERRRAILPSRTALLSFKGLSSLSHFLVPQVGEICPI